MVVSYIMKNNEENAAVKWEKNDRKIRMAYNEAKHNEIL